MGDSFNSTDTDPATAAASFTEGLNPDIHAGLLLSNLVVTTLAAGLCYGLRMYVRVGMVKQLGYDDWVLTSAFALFLLNIAIQFGYAGTIISEGLETAYVPAAQLIVFWGLTYGFLLVLVRGAIAAFFLRLIPELDYDWQRWTIKIGFALFATFTGTYTLVNFFACGNPLDVINSNAVCLNIDALNALALASTTLNMIIDWTLTIVPAIVVFRSQMSARTKASVIAVVALGGTGSIISIVRIPFLSLGNFAGVDAYGNLSKYLVLATWENSIGIMAVSLAACKPLLRKFFPDESRSSSAANNEKGFLPSFVNVDLHQAGNSDRNKVMETQIQVEDIEAAR